MAFHVNDDFAKRVLQNEIAASAFEAAQRPLTESIRRNPDAALALRLQKREVQTPLPPIIDDDHSAVIALQLQEQEHLEQELHDAEIAQRLAGGDGNGRQRRNEDGRVPQLNEALQRIHRLRPSNQINFGRSVRMPFRMGTLPFSPEFHMFGHGELIDSSSDDTEIDGEPSILPQPRPRLQHNRRGLDENDQRQNVEPSILPQPRPRLQHNRRGPEQNRFQRNIQADENGHRQDLQPLPGMFRFRANIDSMPDFNQEQRHDIVQPPNQGNELLKAAADGNVEDLIVCIKNGADLDSINSNGRTALMIAVKSGNIDVTRLLLHNGCDKNAKIQRGRTSLMLAAKNGRLEITQLLLDYKCSKETKDDKGHTALMYAARYGHLPITKLLIENGCNKEETDINGRTVLHLAAEEGELHVVVWLVEQGVVSPLVKTHKNETPYDLATVKRDYSHQQVMLYLQSAMSKAAEDVGPKTPLNKQETLQVRDDTVPTEIKLMSDKRSVPLYLKLLESGSEKKRDIRLVIVGKKGAGKTSLIKRLFSEESTDVTSTNGIEIHTIRCKAESDDGTWNKVDGYNIGTELHARLLKPYEETLISQSKKKIETSVVTLKDISVTVAKESEDTVQQHQEPKRPEASENLLQSSKAIVTQHNPQEACSSQVKSPVGTEYQVKPLVAATLNVEHVPILSGEHQENKHLDQAYLDITSMLKTPVNLHDKEEYATLFLWDFAGDEEFYHTHQTFLSPDAIYIVVTKLNEADNKEAQELFRLWMDSIHCYSTQDEDKYTYEDNIIMEENLDPPVILVGTWKDAVILEGKEIGNACNENLLTYTRNMSDDEREHIRSQYFISNTEDDNVVFHQIRKHILDLARTMKSWNIDYPLKFIQLEKKLQEKKKDAPIISFQDIKHIALGTAQPLNDEELTLFLEFHHEIRALVYFKDLPDYIILDTQWLSDAFKCILTAEKFRSTTIKNQKRWEEFYHRGKLHSEVIEDIFQNEGKMLYNHKDFILDIMEKFDIIICPNISERDRTDNKYCYYVPCVIKAEPEEDIYKMFNVTDDTCIKSSWLCFKFRFLPPHLINHLTASLCRKFEVAGVVTKDQKRQLALFRGSAVFELQKTKMRKLLVMKCPNVIQIQVWQFGKRIEEMLYKYIADFVTEQIIKIISTRFKMSNVDFEKKLDCGQTKPESVTGSNDFMEEHITEYYCDTCTTIHEFIGEWSDRQSRKTCLSGSSEDDKGSTPNKESTYRNIKTSTKVRLHMDSGAMSTVSEEFCRTDNLRGFTQAEINFSKMGMIVLNTLADVLYDLLKQDKLNVPHRANCDITYLYSEHRKLNKHVPSNSWGGNWSTIHAQDISIGDDIERIRLTRNELQHSRTFQLDDIRFNELQNIIMDLLKRFDQHNKPARLYTEQLNEIVAKALSMEEVRSIKTKLNIRSAVAVEIEHETIFQQQDK